MDTDSQWKIVGISGIFFATIYKIPQILKLIKTKQGKDLSKRYGGMSRCILAPWKYNAHRMLLVLRVGQRRNC